MTDITCPACGGMVAERLNATTVRIRHAGRTTTIAGGWVSTTCGQKAPPHYRHCGTMVTLQAPQDDVLE